MPKKPSKKLVDIVLQSLPSDIPQNIVEHWENNLRSLRSTLRNLLYEYPGAVYFPLEVDYDKSIEVLVANGHYVSVHSDVTSSNFHSNETGKKQIIIHLVGRNRRLENDEVKRIPSSYPKSRFANIKEILTLCNFYPTIQNFNPIVALGSTFRDLNPCIVGYGDAKEKTLCLSSIGRYEDREYYDEWSYGTCFALVKLEE